MYIHICMYITRNQGLTFWYTLPISTVYAKKKRSNHYQQQTEASHVNKESCTDLHRKRTNRTVTNRKLKRAMSTEHPALTYFEKKKIDRTVSKSNLKKKSSNRYQQQIEASHVNKDPCIDLHRKRKAPTITNSTMKRPMLIDYPALIYIEKEKHEPSLTANCIVPCQKRTLH